MSLSELWQELQEPSTFIAVGATLAAPMVFALVQLLRFVHGYGRRWRSGGGTVAAGEASSKPRVRGSRRRFLTKPATVDGTVRSEALMAAMRDFGRVPAVYSKMRLVPWGLWRDLRLVLFPTGTMPKSAFTVMEWHYRPVESIHSPTRPSYAAGAVLRFVLHVHENRHHLRRSLMTGGSGSRDRRLVVIASAPDLAKPRAWVRCLSIDASRLLLPNDERGHIVVPTTGGGRFGDGPQFRCRRHEVPDNALWLVVPATSQHSPTALWGEIDERFVVRPAVPAEAEADRLDDDICEQHVRRDVTRFRRLKVVVWVLLGLLPLGFVPLMRRLLRWSFYPDETAALLGGQVAAVYFVVFTYALIAASVWLVVDAFRAKVWRSREGQTPEQWRGGTQECLVMGRLCRNGPILGRRDLAAFSQYG